VNYTDNSFFLQRIFLLDKHKQKSQNGLIETVNRLGRNAMESTRKYAQAELPFDDLFAALEQADAERYARAAASAEAEDLFGDGFGLFVA
jgi:hypothetical protein